MNGLQICKAFAGENSLVISPEPGNLAARTRGVYFSSMASTPQLIESMLAGLQASAGLSCRQIAREAHLSHATIWRMQTGMIRQPTYDSVIRVERLYEAKIGPSPLRR